MLVQSSVTLLTLRGSPVARPLKRSGWLFAKRGCGKKQGEQAELGALVARFADLFAQAPRNLACMAQTATCEQMR